MGIMNAAYADAANTKSMKSETMLGMQPARGGA